MADVLDDQADHVGGRDDALRGGRLLAEGTDSTFIPAFADTPGLQRRVRPRAGNRTADRTDAGWHLLSHTSGLTYGFHHAHPVDAMYRQAGFEWVIPAGHGPRRVLSSVARVPLLFQPGSEWNYGVSTDVLGRVVEVVSGPAAR